MFILILLLNFPSTVTFSRSFKVPKPLAAKSLAIPIIPSASGRLGVIAISTTVSIFLGSFSRNHPTKESPTAPEGISIIPSCSSLKPISRSEHIIPELSTPRICPIPIVVSIPGTYDPGFAMTTFIPARALGAPHIICFWPSSVSTKQTFNLSAFGCCSAALTLPIVNSANFSAGLTICSTSNPKSVRASVI